ncbi:DgyrCDS9455 [Dimorphilus gyrociliatus]|uniref:DgyrCDS9455 n=1 Tax=Dimorphilus gyrociliatus TaxID=2664684 RepID=A0A7I8VXD8_9ANNE|nr:DgyrCDS9455 [Dimorphilus gyrociliatus]
MSHKSLHRSLKYLLNFQSFNNGNYMLPLKNARNASTMHFIKNELLNITGRNQQRDDLRMFLKEIGTDPKEARFWMKQFTAAVDPFKPFAIVQIDNHVFTNRESVKKLGSYLSFLQRNGMKVMIVHGSNGFPHAKPTNLQTYRREITNNTMLLVSILESFGAEARPIFGGHNVLQADRINCNNFYGRVTEINRDVIKWALQSGHIPVIEAIGETADGQLLNIDLWETVVKLSTIFVPQKVINVNKVGGIFDENGRIIPNINFPNDLESSFSKSWCTPELKDKISNISELLQLLPNECSVVITSPTNILTELFTHNGAGTMLRSSDKVLKLDSLKAIDDGKLTTLLNKSFKKNLKKSYLTSIEERPHTIYLSTSYSAAAIITIDKEVPIPYLCKFAISETKQGEGVSDLLWKMIKQDHSKLFWRSRWDNRINPWYFKRCEGSWSNGKWTVFWYGINNHQESSALIEHALSLPDCFNVETLHSSV